MTIRLLAVFAFAAMMAGCYLPISGRVTDFWDTTADGSTVPPQITNPSVQSSAGLGEYTNANFVSGNALKFNGI